MTDLDRLSETQKALRLIYKGLHPRASALSGDPEYRALLRHWRADPEFQLTVRDLAPMLELRIVDVVDQGIVLAPDSPDSYFAATLSDLRPGLGDMSRGSLALVQIAIAATFFPTAAALTGADDDGGDISATPDRIAQFLREHCERLEEEASDDAALHEAGMVKAWRELARLPEVPPDGSRRAAMNSLVGMVKIVLNQLEKHGMVNQVPETENAYAPTPRYRLQVRELAANDIFERCAAIIPGFLQQDS